MRSARFAVASTAFVIGALAARDASAGNVDSFMLGNDAPLMGGAVTASASGSTAIWYNPAGIERGTSQSVDVAFNAYVLRFGGAPDLTVDEANGGSRKTLTNLDISPVPTVLAYTRRIGGWQLGAGLYVPNRGLGLPRTLVQVQNGDQLTTIVRDGSSRFTEYYAGLAVGRALTQRFRIGGAFFGYYSSQIDSEIIYAGAKTSSLDFFAFSHQTRDVMRLGYQAVWGMQWSATDDLDLGVTFRSPVFEAYRRTQAVDVDGIAISDSNRVGSNAAVEEETGTKGTVIRPMRVHAGAAWRHDEWQVGVDGSVQAPFHSGAIEDDMRAVWNARAGVMNTISNKLAVGGGVFTDFSPYDPRSTTRASVDYYGVCIAARLGELLKVRTDDDPKERPLLFGSTFAVSYAFGDGMIANQQLAAVNGGAATTERIESITAHELVFHIGSSLAR